MIYKEAKTEKLESNRERQKCMEWSDAEDQYTFRVAVAEEEQEEYSQVYDSLTMVLAFLMELHLHWHYFNIRQEVFFSFTVYTTSFGKTDVTWSQVGAVWWMIQGSEKKKTQAPLDNFITAIL